jgi:transcriptional regulator with XRE-family HTH domain
MSESSKREYPYKPLGSWLKGMRQKKQESLDEVSGAVEIDVDLLSDIERGAKRPGEDILTLLISYFAVKDEDAVEVWEMAGYSKPDEALAGHSHSSDDKDSDDSEHAQPVLVMPMDARIVYTDLVHMTKNKYGLTINFLQSDGIGSQPLAVSRVGMSNEHAEKLLKLLSETLRAKEQKLLPAPDSTDDKKDA